MHLTCNAAIVAFIGVKREVISVYVVHNLTLNNKTVFNSLIKYGESESSEPLDQCKILKLIKF